VIDETAQEVLDVLRAPDLTDAQRRERIESIAYERFDFETMSKLVLARDWRKLDRTQRGEFVEAFKAHLSRSYGSRIERYDQGGVEITGDRLEPRGDVTVRTRIVGGEADGIAVDYRLRHRGEGWRVIDVVIEGVSLVSSFRDQFGEVMSREGPEGLLQRLREKNAAPPPGAGSAA
jgi:phospholipid transport system substrate-binding protein